MTMQDDPRVSIITPFRNAAPYLQQAIDSVRAQTFGDWELLLVDDGSTDDGPEIARRACESDYRIRMLRTPGKGAAVARNAGLASTRGAFVAFLDADDVYEPSMLETVLAVADANREAAMIFGPALWWHPDGSRPDWLEATHGLADRLHRPPSLLIRLILLQDGHVPCTCAVLIRREALNLTGGFEENFTLYEDQALWAKLFLKFPAYVTPVRLSRYRQHGGSVSAAAVRDGRYDRLSAHPARAEFLDWLAAYVERAGVSGWKLGFALALARAPYAGASTLKTRAEHMALRLCTFTIKARRRLRRMAAMP